MSFFSMFEECRSPIDKKEILELKRYLLDILITRLYNRSEEDEDYEEIDMDEFNELRQSVGKEFSNVLDNINSDTTQIVAKFDKFFCSEDSDNKNIDNEDEEGIDEVLSALKSNILDIVSHQTYIRLCNIEYKNLKIDLEESNRSYVEEQSKLLNEMIVSSENIISLSESDIKELADRGFNIDLKSVVKGLQEDAANLVLELNNKLDSGEDNYSHPEHGKYWSDRMAKNELDTPGGWFDN